MPDATPPAVIHFYSTTGDYDCFSNFGRPRVHLKGENGPTSAYYFQTRRTVSSRNRHETETVPQASALG